jgi:hypothetical protein
MDDRLLPLYPDSNARDACTHTHTHTHTHNNARCILSSSPRGGKLACVSLILLLCGIKNENMVEG